MSIISFRRSSWEQSAAWKKRTHRWPQFHEMIEGKGRWHLKRGRLVINRLSEKSIFLSWHRNVCPSHICHKVNSLRPRGPLGWWIFICRSFLGRSLKIWDVNLHQQWRRECEWAKELGLFARIYHTLKLCVYLGEKMYCLLMRVHCRILSISNNLSFKRKTGSVNRPTAIHSPLASFVVSLISFSFPSTPASWVFRWKRRRQPRKVFALWNFDGHLNLGLRTVKLR